MGTQLPAGRNARRRSAQTQLHIRRTRQGGLRTTFRQTGQDALASRLLLRGCFSCIKSRSVENVTVQHDVELVGKSGCAHQIDVYWEFRLAGQTYKTAIECKAFNQNVPIGRIRDFYGVLLDVPNLNGVFATLVGYQSGAKCYAKHYGVSLKEIRVPQDSDWDGLIKDIHINLIAVSTRITQFSPRASQAFKSKLVPGETLQIEEKIMSHDPCIFDHTGTVKISPEDLQQRLPSAGIAAIAQKHFIPLPNHTVKIGDMQAEIDGVDITYDIHINAIQTSILGQELVQAVIKDVATGEVKFVDKAGNQKWPPTG